MKDLKLQTLGMAFIAVLFVVGTLSFMGALITVSNVSSVGSTWDTFEAGRSEKASTLSALRKEIGYGGMIHQFKNYILRQDGERIGLINQKLGGAISVIANYRAPGHERCGKGRPRQYSDHASRLWRRAVDRGGTCPRR